MSSHGLVWFCGISNIVGYLKPNLFLYIWTVLYQTTQSSISTLFCSIWSIDRTLSGATTPERGGPESNENKGVLRVPQSSSIAGRSKSDCLGHSLVESYTSAEIQSVYSTAPMKSYNWCCCCIATKYVHICMQNHNNTIKTSDTVLRKIYLSFYLKGWCVRGSWRPNRTATYWPPTLLAIIAFLSRSSVRLNRGLGAHSAGCWFSLPHLISDSSDLQLNCSIRGLRAQPLRVLVFSTASYLRLIWSPTNWLPAFTRVI